MLGKVALINLGDVYFGHFGPQVRRPDNQIYITEIGKIPS